MISNSNLKLNFYFQDRPRVGKVAVVPGQIYPGRGHRGHHRLQQLAQIRYILSINDVTNFLATFLTPFLPNATPISRLFLLLCAMSLYLSPAVSYFHAHLSRRRVVICSLRNKLLIQNIFFASFISVKKNSFKKFKKFMTKWPFQPKPAQISEYFL